MQKRFWKHVSIIPPTRQRLRLRLALLTAVRFSTAAKAAKKRQRRKDRWNYYNMQSGLESMFQWFLPLSEAAS